MPDRRAGMSISQLPWPKGWGKERAPTAMIYVFILFSIGAVTSVPYAIDAATSGGGIRTYYGIGIGMVCLSFVAIAVPRLRVRRTKFPSKVSVTSASTGRSGTLLPYVSSSKIILLCWLSVGAVFVAVRALLVVSEMLTENHNSARSSVDVGSLVILLVLLAVIIFLLVSFFGGRGRRPGCVILDESGVFQEFGHTSRFIPWEDVGTVFATIENNTHMVRILPDTEKKISVESGRGVLDRMQRGYFERYMDIPAGVLGIDPPLLLYTVRFYWQNPAARDELRTEAAIERMRHGELISGDA